MQSPQVRITTLDHMVVVFRMAQATTVTLGGATTGATSPGATTGTTTGATGTTVAILIYLLRSLLEEVKL